MAEDSKKLSTAEGKAPAKPNAAKPKPKPKPYKRVTISNGKWGTQIDERDLGLWQKDGFKVVKD